MAAIYVDMPRFAMSRMSSKRRDNALRPTELVHGTPVRLIDGRNANRTDQRISKDDGEIDHGA